MALGKCDTTGKTVYPTRQDAQTALLKLAVRRRGHKTEQTKYRCMHCGKWHVSSMVDKHREKIPRLTPAERWKWDGVPPTDEEE